MTYVFIALAAIFVAALALYFLRRPGPAQLPPAETDKALGAGKAPAESTGPTLKEKLEARKAAMAEPVGDEPESDEGGTARTTPVVPSVVEKPATDDAQTVVAQVSADTMAALGLGVHKVPARVATRDAVGELRKGLSRARADEGFFGRIAAVVRGKKEIDPRLVDEIEEVLVTSDVGVKGADKILARLREALSRNELGDPSRVWQALRAESTKMVDLPNGGGLRLGKRPTVVMMVGVNGAGKTTTIGKIATKLRAEGRGVVLAAGDTFRAAAVQQLEVWGKRVGCEVVKGKDGADPAAVAFDAVQKATASGADVVLVDTAGRLQTKAPLMDELKKIARTLGKAAEGAPHETWLVLDATTGQNALSQARQFGETLPLTGVVLTKLDGTAKGGIVLSICEEMNVPVRYIGLGERADDLHAFVAEEFIEALFGDTGRTQDAA